MLKMVSAKDGLTSAVYNIAYLLGTTRTHDRLGTRIFCFSYLLPAVHVLFICCDHILAPWHKEIHYYKNSFVCEQNRFLKKHRKYSQEQVTFSAKSKSHLTTVALCEPYQEHQNIPRWVPHDLAPPRSPVPSKTYLTITSHKATRSVSHCHRNLPECAARLSPQCQLRDLWMPRDLPWLVTSPESTWPLCGRLPTVFLYPALFYI